MARAALGIEVGFVVCVGGILSLMVLKRCAGQRSFSVHLSPAGDHARRGSLISNSCHIITPDNRLGELALSDEKIKVDFGT